MNYGKPTEMNPSIREHFTILGVPKLKRSEQDAMEYAEDNDLNAYQCSFCDGWHVGSRTWDDE